jgi:carboxyl-terminal processing protease
MTERRRLPGWRIAAGALALAAVASACGNGTGPSEMSEEARAYLEEVLAPMEDHALHRHDIDWAAFRAEVFATAGNAQRVQDTYLAIERGLRLLGDGNSTFRTQEGILLFVSPNPCGAVSVTAPPLPADIGYVRIRAFIGVGTDGDLYILDTQLEMADRDGDSVVGWIVDLRGNVGGNFWPMLAAVGPLLGEGVVGFYRDSDGVDHAWEYRDGSAFLAGVEMHGGPPPYQPRTDTRRVAILTDNRTIGAGEGVAVAFRGRSDSRSFGEASCGISTATRTFHMSDGGRLELTTYVMADRTGVGYGAAIVPDRVLPGVIEPVEEAVEWLRSGD